MLHRVYGPSKVTKIEFQGPQLPNQQALLLSDLHWSSVALVPLYTRFSSEEQNRNNHQINGVERDENRSQSNLDLGSEPSEQKKRDIPDNSIKNCANQEGVDPSSPSQGVEPAVDRKHRQENQQQALCVSSKGLHGNDAAGLQELWRHCHANNELKITNRLEDRVDRFPLGSGTWVDYGPDFFEKPLQRRAFDLAGPNSVGDQSEPGIEAAKCKYQPQSEQAFIVKTVQFPIHEDNPPKHSRQDCAVPRDLAGCAAGINDQAETNDHQAPSDENEISSTPSTEVQTKYGVPEIWCQNHTQATPQVCYQRGQEGEALRCGQRFLGRDRKHLVEEVQSHSGQRLT